MVKTICFCVFLLRGSFWSLFGIFYLFWVGLGGHLGSPWCPIGGVLLFLWSLLGSSNVLSVSLLDQVYRLMGSKINVVFNSCFYEDFGSIWGTLWGTILVKNQEKCVAKTGLREVVKIVRKKR